MQWSAAMEGGDGGDDAVQRPLPVPLSRRGSPSPAGFSPSCSASGTYSGRNIAELQAHGGGDHATHGKSAGGDAVVSTDPLEDDAPMGSL
jgi:hypothetical protein